MSYFHMLNHLFIVHYVLHTTTGLFYVICSLFIMSCTWLQIFFPCYLFIIHYIQHMATGPFFHMLFIHCSFCPAHSYIFVFHVKPFVHCPMPCTWLQVLFLYIFCSLFNVLHIASVLISTG